ncbi:MAG TPA: DUF302 domain-containing protein [Anaerolineales bacterium]|nr:DUF302 domain-containing protein [Anaerolineales bacterium]
MTTELGFHAKLNLPYEQAVQKTTEALKAEGFGVLTEIDVKATLKQKLNADFRRLLPRRGREARAGDREGNPAAL